MLVQGELETILLLPPPCVKYISSEYYLKNRKLFWIEVKREMGENSEACRIRRSTVVVVERNEEVKEVSKMLFKSSMNEESRNDQYGIKVHEGCMSKGGGRKG